MFENNTTSATTASIIAIYPYWCHLVICVISILCCVVGIIGNVFIILAVAIFSEMRVMTNYLVVNLAVCDILLIVFTLPQQVAYHLETRIFEWPFYKCYFQFYMANAAGLISVYTLVGIAFERYQGICLIRKMTDKKGVYLYILAIWIVSLLINVPRISFTTYEVHKLKGTTIINVSCLDKWPTHQDQHVYNTIIDIFIFYVIPISLFAVFYSFILYKVWHRKIPTEAHLSDVQRRKIHKSKVLTVKMFVTVTLIFIILWLPNTLLYILMALDVNIYAYRYAQLLVDTTVLFLLTNSGVNFLVYALWDKKFRRSFLKILRFKSHNGRLDGLSTSSASTNSTYIRSSKSGSAISLGTKKQNTPC